MTTGRVEGVIRREVAEPEAEMALCRATLPQQEPERTRRALQHSVMARRRLALLEALADLAPVAGG